MSGFADLFARCKLLPLRTPGEAPDQLLKLSESKEGTSVYVGTGISKSRSNASTVFVIM